jgi:hypothetical protein
LSGSSWKSLDNKRSLQVSSIQTVHTLQIDEDTMYLGSFALLSVDQTETSPSGTSVVTCFGLSLVIIGNACENTWSGLKLESIAGYLSLQGHLTANCLSRIILVPLIRIPIKQVSRSRLQCPKTECSLFSATVMFHNRIHRLKTSSTLKAAKERSIHPIQHDHPNDRPKHDRPVPTRIWSSDVETGPETHKVICLDLHRRATSLTIRIQLLMSMSKPRHNLALKHEQ